MEQNRRTKKPMNQTRCKLTVLVNPERKKRRSKFLQVRKENRKKNFELFRSVETFLFASEHVILRVPLLYGEVENLDENAVTILLKNILNTKTPVRMDEFVGLKLVFFFIWWELNCCFPAFKHVIQRTSAMWLKFAIVCVRDVWTRFVGFFSIKRKVSKLISDFGRFIWKFRSWQRATLVLVDFKGWQRNSRVKENGGGALYM